MRIEPLAVPSGADVLTVLPRLARALEGGSPVAPYAAGSPPPDLAPHDPAGLSDKLPDDLAVVVGTSGSTGAPKRAMLTAANLRGSIDATASRLAGHGQWLLTVPGHHVAGLQVLLRSLVAGTTPHVMDPGEGFTPSGWSAAVDAMPATDRPTYVSLVPTQLNRLLTDADATERLARFTAVLVGGAATHPDLLARAADSGVDAVTTYGMSETAGGCVYSGRPLDGVGVHLDDDRRIHLTGTVVAAGYLGARDLSAAAFPEPGTFRTDDVGRVDEHGRLHVLGRVDDLITTGGLKVAPRAVEEAVASLTGIREAVVVGLPDPEWGESIAVLVVCDPTQPSFDVTRLRERLRGILPDHALPRAVREVAAMPTRGPGKPDRAAIRALLGDVGE